MISRRPVETIIASYSIPRVTYLFHQNWRPEELANVESMSCSRMNSRCRSQSCDDCVDPGINGLHCPLTQCITQGASFDMESTQPSDGTAWCPCRRFGRAFRRRNGAGLSNACAAAGTACAG